MIFNISLEKIAKATPRISLHGHQSRTSDASRQEEITTKRDSAGKKIRSSQSLTFFRVSIQKSSYKKKFPDLPGIFLSKTLGWRQYFKDFLQLF